MHSLDEQMSAIECRSRRLQQEQRRRRRLLREAGMVCACLVLIAGASLWVSSLTGAALPVVVSPYGSLITGSHYIGYVVIGVLAFGLGIAVTLLGFHLRMKEDREGDRNKR